MFGFTLLNKSKKKINFSSLENRLNYSDQNLEK